MSLDGLNLDVNFEECKKCKKIVYSFTCDTCGSFAETIECKNNNKEDVEVSSTNHEHDDWIGPIANKKCKICSLQTLYYQMRDPVSADEGVRIFYLCKNCSGKLIN